MGTAHHLLAAAVQLGAAASSNPQTRTQTKDFVAHASLAPTQRPFGWIKDGNFREDVCHTCSPPSFMHWLTRRTSRLRTCGEPALLCSLHSPMERRCLVLEYLVHATTSPTLRRGRGTSKKWSCCLPQRKGWALRSFSGTACIARHLSTLQRMPPNSTPICIANPNLSGNCKGHYSLATQCLTGPQRCSQT